VVENLLFLPALYLKLPDNLIHCDKAVVWMLGVPSTWNLVMDSLVTPNKGCASPAHLVGVPWADITLQDVFGNI